MYISEVIADVVRYVMTYIISGKSRARINPTSDLTQTYAPKPNIHLLPTPILDTSEAERGPSAR